MWELVPGVSVPPETLGPPPVGRDTDEEVGQPPGALIADLRVQGNLPLVVHSCLVGGVETDKVVKVLQSRSQRVELICQLRKAGRLVAILSKGGEGGGTHPEISEHNKRDWCQEYPESNLKQPPPRLILQHLERIEEEKREGDHHGEGGVEGGYGEEVSEDEGDDAGGPDDSQPGGGLQEVEVRGEVAGVQLEYQLVVHSSCCPASVQIINNK